MYGVGLTDLEAAHCCTRCTSAAITVLKISLLLTKNDLIILIQIRSQMLPAFFNLVFIKDHLVDPNKVVR